MYDNKWLKVNDVLIEGVYTARLVHKRHIIAILHTKVHVIAMDEPGHQLRPMADCLSMVARLKKFCGR